MARFWKFNAFVGTVGLLLLGTAFFTGTHDYSVVKGVYHVQWTAMENVDKLAIAYATAGAVCLVWQVFTTFVGLLTGFFRGSGTPHRHR